MKRLLSLILIFSLPALLNGQEPILHWKFTNPVEYGDGEFYYFDYDVELSCDIAGTFHTGLRVCIRYDTLAYGPNAVTAGMVTVQKEELLQGSYQSSPKYNVSWQDDGPGTIVIESDANLAIASPLFTNEVPLLPVYKPVCHLTFRIRRVSPDGFFKFEETGMNGNQYYVDPSHPSETRYGLPPGFEGVYENDIAGMVGSHATWYDLKIFLEGPYDTASHKMDTDLNDNNLIPLAHPYNPQLPYYSNPEPVWYFNKDVTVSSIPPDAVDWVYLEVRDAPDALSATPETAIAKGVFFLRSNGEIVNLNGMDTIEFDTPWLVTKGMFVAAWHRNHLGIMNALPLVSFKSSKCYLYTYDFSLDPTQVHGGQLSMNEVEQGVWAMIAGDGNGDGQTGNGDKLDVWAVNAGASGYLGGDFNMDGQCNMQDKVDIFEMNAGSGSQIPD